MCALRDVRTRLRHGIEDHRSVTCNWIGLPRWPGITSLGRRSSVVFSSCGVQTIYPSVSTCGARPHAPWVSASDLGFGQDDHLNLSILCLSAFTAPRRRSRRVNSPWIANYSSRVSRRACEVVKWSHRRCCHGSGKKFINIFQNSRWRGPKIQHATYTGSIQMNR